MGITTNPTGAAGGLDRDESDFKRLRHARERHLGFELGRYLQPPPMLFTGDGHNVFLGDMYRGHTAFLLCGGPSLTSHDLSRLHNPGILTMAINNAAVVFRPQLWCSVDDPGNFCDAIWYDPGIMKFVPMCHMEKHFMVRDSDDQLINSPHRVIDMPAVFGYRRNEAFVAEQWLYEDTFNWGNYGNRTDEYGIKGSRSVMYIALRLLFYLGIRRLFLLGCDFRMNNKGQNYAFDQDRTRSSVHGNNKSYSALNVRLQHLQPYFEKEGYEIFNCTPESGLTVFPHRSFEDAVVEATSIIPKTIHTIGMYDRQQRERKSANAHSEIKVSAPSTAPNMEHVLETGGQAIEDYPETTLVTAIDELSAEALKHTWSTWMQFKPWFREIPILIAHARSFDLKRAGLEFVFEHPKLEVVPYDVTEGRSAKEQMEYEWVRIPAERVVTDWYLKLAPEAIACGCADWVRPQWFAPNANGDPPVFVSHQWGYSKPADVIEQMDEWSEGVPELDERPPLNLPYDPDDSRIRYDTISSWCFFGNTSWTKEALRYVPDGLPCSHETFVNYCAMRRGDHRLRLNLKECGWEHSFRFNARAFRRCRELLRESV